MTADSRLMTGRRDMLRWSTAALVGGLTGVSSADIGQSSPDRRKRMPNLLFICADEMRAPAMSCAGNTNLLTRNMDRLAKEGVRFSHTYTTSPLCSPARSSMMTGLWPHRAGVTNNNMRLKPDVSCIAEITAAAGYRTGHIGKWHLHGGFAPGKSDYAFVPPGHHRGFQYWAGFEHGHTYFGSKYYTDSDRAVHLPQDSWEPDVQTDLAIEFIKANAAGPWHLDLSWGPPHFPLGQARPDDLSLFSPDRIKLRQNVPAAFENLARQDLCAYYAMITGLDCNLGRLLDVLDDLNIYGDTIVVFTSDHGDMMLSHGQHYKRRPQEEAARVPLLLRYPRAVPGGRRYGGLTSLVDVVPTLLTLMGLESPDTDGLDFSGFLRGKDAGPGRKYIFMECPQLGCRDFDPGPFGRAAWRAVRDERHKAVFLKIDDSRAELIQMYDLIEDPYEMTNLADDPSKRDCRGRLAHLLAEWVRATDDGEFAALEIRVS